MQVQYQACISRRMDLLSDLVVSDSTITLTISNYRSMMKEAMSAASTNATLARTGLSLAHVITCETIKISRNFELTDLLRSTCALALWMHCLCFLTKHLSTLKIHDTEGQDVWIFAASSQRVQMLTGQ